MMQVYLSQQLASPEWGETALLSHDLAGWQIHQAELTAIQQAARRRCEILRRSQRAVWHHFGHAHC